MRRTAEISGDWLAYIFYGVSIAGLLVILSVVVWPLDGFADVAFAVLLVSLAIATAIGLWRRRTDRTGAHLRTDEDIAYDPVAYPGQAARERWERAVRRLPGGDEEEE
jgi:hypothetical protein